MRCYKKMTAELFVRYTVPPGGTGISLAYLQQRDQVDHSALLG